MQLSFTVVNNNGYANMYQYPIHQNFHEAINENFGLDKKKQYFLSFGRYVDFDPEFHGISIKYLFTDDKTKLRRTVIGETANDYQVKYEFENDVKQDLNQEQILFLCGILHHLNLKTYLIAFLSILLIDYKFQLNDINNHVKNDCFNVQIFGQ